MVPPIHGPGEAHILHILVLSHFPTPDEVGDSQGPEPETCAFDKGLLKSFSSVHLLLGTSTERKTLRFIVLYNKIPPLRVAGTSFRIKMCNVIMQNILSSGGSQNEPMFSSSDDHLLRFLRSALTFPQTAQIQAKNIHIYTLLHVWTTNYSVQPRARTCQFFFLTTPLEKARKASYLRVALIHLHFRRWRKAGKSAAPALLSPRLSVDGWMEKKKIKKKK